MVLLTIFANGVGVARRCRVFQGAIGASLFGLTKLLDVTVTKTFKALYDRGYVRVHLYVVVENRNTFR